MGSLARCLKKAGLDKHEAAILKGAAADYQGEGVEAQQAAQQAIRDHIEDLFAERADIVRQVREAGGMAPAAEFALSELFPEDASGQGQGVERVVAAISEFIPDGGKLKRILVVHATQRDAVASGMLSEGAASKGLIKGFVHKGKAHLIAENLPAGRELGAFLHEVGVHLGMEKLIGRGNMQWLAHQVETWARKDDGSLESRVAKAAVYRADRSQSKGPNARQEELIAYMVEGLANEGVTPQTKEVSPAHGWLRTLWAAAKRALRALGFKSPERFTGQMLVDLAYGAADLEVSGATQVTAQVAAKQDSESIRFSNEELENDESRSTMNDDAEFAAVKEKFNRAAEKIKALYGGQEGYEGLLAGTRAFFNSVRPWVSGASNWFHAAVPYARRLKVEADGLRQVLVDREGGAFDARLHHEHQLGKFTGYSTVADLEEDPVSKKVTLKVLVIADDLVARAKREAAEYGLDANEVIHTYGPTLTVDVQEDGEMVIHGPHADTAYGQALLKEGAARLARGKDGKVIRYSDGTPWTALTDSGATQLAHLLADIHARLQVYNGKEQQGVWWKRVTGATGDESGMFGRKGAVYFSEGIEVPPEVTETMSGMGKALHNTWANVDANNRWKQMAPKLMTLHQLNDWFGSKLKTLGKYVKNFDLMAMLQQQILRKGHLVTQDWVQLSKGERKQLHGVMLDATLRGIHPDQPINDPGNAHLAPTEREAYEALKRRYEALPENAKQVYQAAKQRLAENWELRRSIYNDVVTGAYARRIATLDPAKDAKRIEALQKERDAYIREHDDQVRSVKGPYFPLMRFGDYIVQARSKALADLEQQLESAEPHQTAALRKRVEAMRTQKQHYRVEAFQSSMRATQRAEQLGRQGLTVTPPFKAAQFNTQFRPFAAASMEQVMHMVDASFSGKGEREAANKMKDMLNELMITSLPEHAALKRQLKREGIEGASDEMLRAFGETIERDAFFLSRLQYSKELTDNMFALKMEAREAGIPYQHVYDNLEQRIALDYTFAPHGVQDLIAKLSGAFHLTLSPAFLLTNMTQPWMITVPQLAGHYGMGRTFGAMRQAWADAGKVIKAGKGGVLNLNDLDFNQLPAGAERDMLKWVADLGQLDITQTADMGLLAEGMNPKYYKWMKAFNWATHHIEMHNRVTTALAAYRLAKNGGANEDTARSQAYDAVVRTQLDYSTTNAAYFMKQGVGPLGNMNKLVYQFRKYQQGMIYLLVRNAKLAFSGDAEAARALAYLMGMQVAFAGAVGVPLFAPVMGLLAAMADDDDEKGDPETRLRNWAADLVGPDAARALFKGLPTLLGVDVSLNLGMSNLLSPLPMLSAQDVVGQSTGRKAVGNVTAAAAGAWTGMLTGVYDAIAQGDVSKALPRFARHPVQAVGYATEGLVTRRGATVFQPDQFDGWDLAYKTLGFSPTKVSEYYTASHAREDVSQAIADRRRQLLVDYSRAKLASKSTADVEAAIKEFNADHPSKEYRIDRSTLIKSVQARRKGEKERDASGAALRKQDKALTDITRFAQ